MANANVIINITEPSENSKMEMTPFSVTMNDSKIIVDSSSTCTGSTSPTSPPGLNSPQGKGAKRPSLPLPTLRVEQLREEGCSSPGSSAYNSEDSEFSDSDVISRLGEFVAPPDDMAQKIAEQMDFYFSDDNILKDSFLLKHVRRNKDGYVNLKLMTSFKKMKTLTRDYRVVAYSLRQFSNTLIVNPEGNKAKRKEPLPDHDETKSSRTVVAVNLPLANNTGMDVVTNFFQDCGEIVMLKLHKPGKAIPSDIKKYLLKHPDPESKIIAVIEFEKHANACKAVEMSTDDEDWSQGLRVVMLSATKQKGGDDSESESEVKQKKRNKKKTGRKVFEREHEGFSSGSEGDFLMPRPRSRNSSFGSENSLPGNGKTTSSRVLLSPTNHPDKQFISPNSIQVSNQRRRSMPLPQSPLADSPKTTPKHSPKPSPKSSPRASPEMRRRANSGSAPNSSATDAGNSNSPWVQRRIQASREMSPLAKGVLNTRKTDYLMRAPRGPEPGKGFYGGKGRGRTLVSAEV